MPKLIRDRDGEGYYGCNVQALDFDGETPGGKVVGNEPMVGYCLKVGTMTAGTYSSRDWWMTTPITEIISETDDEILCRICRDNSRDKSLLCIVEKEQDLIKKSYEG